MKFDIDTDNNLNVVGSDCSERQFACNYYCSPKGDKKEILFNVDFI